MDGQIIAGIQRILKSPGSDVILTDVGQIRIYKADSADAQIGGYVDVWTYTGANSAPDVDPGAGSEFIDFSASSTGWPVCSRDSESASPDAVGVQIPCTYRLQTALGGMMSFLRGNQAATIAMNDQTVMVLNP